MKSSKQFMFVLTTLAVILAVAAFLPGVIGAGDLEPPGPPNSTMSPLDQLPPTWSHILPASARFEVLEVPCFTNLCPHPPPIWGVLDKETGLVWQYSPYTSLMSWGTALAYCYQLEIEGRMGWRPPTIEELSSLIDRSQDHPALPSGHPFINVRLDYNYWSSTTLAGSLGQSSNYSRAWSALFSYGTVSNSYDKTEHNFIWCVRGGVGHDAY